MSDFRGTGVRGRPAGVYVVGEPVDGSMAELRMDVSAEEGSRDLLRRQLEVGQHCITDPVKFRATCEVVGILQR